MTVSVIIPVYNAAATIVATIKSVLNQSLPPQEVIVVNDASTDETAALLKTHFSGRITYVCLTENKGPAYARNEGIGRATGTHIAFQDADDCWHLRKLELMTHVFEHQPEIQFLFHLYTLSPIEVRADKAKNLKAVAWPFLSLLMSNPIGTPCVMFRNTPGLRFDEQMRYMEDYDLFLREAYKKGAYFLNLPLTRLSRPILSAGGLSDNRWKMRKGELRVYCRLPRLNPLFIFLVPLLVVSALVKHWVKSFRPPRSNY